MGRKKKNLLEDGILFTAEELGMVDDDGNLVDTDDNDNDVYKVEDRRYPIWDFNITQGQRQNRELMDIAKHFAATIRFPDTYEIEFMLEALEICFPYQIKKAITILKLNNPRCTSFGYVFTCLKRGQFGTRENDIYNNEIDKGYMFKINSYCWSKNGGLHKIIDAREDNGAVEYKCTPFNNDAESLENIWVNQTDILSINILDDKFKITKVTPRVIGYLGSRYNELKSTIDIIDKDFDKVDEKNNK